jgi:hypothetical protein
VRALTDDPERIADVLPGGVIKLACGGNFEAGESRSGLSEPLRNDGACEVRAGRGERALRSVVDETVDSGGDNTYERVVRRSG